MFEFNVTPEFLLIVVAGTLAFLFDYFPGLATWFDALSAATKKQLNAGLILGTAVVLFAGTCFALFVTNLVCTVAGGFEALKIVFLALTVNQGVHFALKPTYLFKQRLGIVKAKSRK